MTNQLSSSQPHNLQTDSQVGDGLSPETLFIDFPRTDFPSERIDFKLCAVAAMGFIKDKVIAPIAGHVAKHTSTETGHHVIEAVGTDKVRQQGHNRQ